MEEKENIQQEKNQEINSQQAKQPQQEQNDYKRYVTAGVLVALLVGVLFINNAFVIWLSLGICFILAYQESLSLFGLKKSILHYGSAIALWILAYFNSSPIQSGIFLAMIVASFLAYKRSISPKNILPFIYPTIPFLALYALYAKMGGFGISCLIWLIVTVAITDTGAYFGGKIFGRTPLSPTSPNKTLEGAGIGLALGIIAGSIAGIGPSGGFIPSLLISIGVSLFSIFGDLFESYLKREADVKDSGKILPGHGGVLDRFDGILFGAVAMYYLLCFLPMWQQL